MELKFFLGLVAATRVEYIHTANITIGFASLVQMRDGIQRGGTMADWVMASQVLTGMYLSPEPYALRPEP